MSFDLFLMTCRYDGTTEMRLNPFTKAMAEFPRNEPMNEGEIAAIHRVLRAAAGPPVDEHYDITLPDGGCADVYASGTEGCSFAIRGVGMTPAMARVVYDVMVAGGLVLVSDDCAAAPPNARIENPLESFGEIVIVRSADDLGAMLVGGFEKWAAYRDSVCG